MAFIATSALPSTSAKSVVSNKCSSVVMSAEPVDNVSRRAFLFTTLATVSAAVAANQAAPALADGAVSAATKNRARTLYGKRILALSPIIETLPALVNKQEWILVDDVVKLPTNKNPEAGVLIREKNAFSLFISGAFGDNKDIANDLKSLEATIFDKSKAIEDAVYARNKADASKAVAELVAAFEEFKRLGNIKENPFADSTAPAK
eukprot:CAMPEP_0184699620 /NCGR_PEP_ID=MMETSP0313-20130426/5832_1 /TAXON_ID=2792 /ORGANISM="Porphyridium aerugineum, Strain SAG 1380-2" /LENGTH=205 /DNA_ID=CAMNT_0027158739 /DNA_START=97 /DNA_END=714 /DNA_ORIENTATION=+